MAGRKTRPASVLILRGQGENTLLVGIFTTRQLKILRNHLEQGSRSWRGEFQGLAKGIVQAIDDSLN
jgi:hypothetical protein